MFAPLIHPASYALIAKYAPTLQPNRFGPVPNEQLHRMQVLAAHFGLEQLSMPDPLVRRLDWITRPGPEAPRQSCDRLDPDAEFFVRMTPSYS